MFCPKCGTQLPDGSGFCTGCGTKLSSAPRARAPRERTGYNSLLSLAFATVAFIFLFLPLLSNGVGIIAAEVFDLHVMVGIGKIFMIIAAVIYLGIVAINLMNLNLPAAVKNLAPLCFYGVVLFSQLFVMIGCIAEKFGITLGASWYIMLLVDACGILYELFPNLFKLKK